MITDPEDYEDEDEGCGASYGYDDEDSCEECGSSLRWMNNSSYCSECDDNVRESDYNSDDHDSDEYEDD